jgi:hypothetical protein
MGISETGSERSGRLRTFATVRVVNAVSEIPVECAGGQVQLQCGDLSGRLLNTWKRAGQSKRRAESIIGYLGHMARQLNGAVVFAVGSICSAILAGCIC